MTPRAVTARRSRSHGGQSPQRSHTAAGHHHRSPPVTVGSATATAGEPRARHDGRYPGGKNAAGTFQWLIGMMPTHARYAEPFAGSAALARRKVPALETILIDSDPKAIRFLVDQRLPAATVIQDDGLTWLANYLATWGVDDLIYCDPPYMHEARVKTRVYADEWSKTKHGRFLAIVRQLPCLVMVSGYRTPLYDRALRTWHRRARYVVTRGATTRQECVWSNFDPADAALYSPCIHYAGRDYRERERIKRKAARWARMLADMQSDAERSAVLAATLDAYARGRKPCTS